MSPRWVTSSILVAGFLLAAVWIGLRTELQGWMGAKAWEITLQFWVLVVLGGGVSFVHQLLMHDKEERQRAKREERDAAEQQRRSLLGTHDELFSAYHKTKRVRWLLRARVLHAASEKVPAEAQVIRAADYDEQMETLIDAQLEFGSIEKHVDPWLFEGERRAAFSEALNTIRAYLHKPLEEYEDQRTRFGDESAERSLTTLPELMEFIGPIGRGREYQRDFDEPFRTALRCLRLEIQSRSYSLRRETLREPPARVSPLVLGVGEGPLRVVPPRREWAGLFEREAARLGEGIESLELIEHIGSTSVPGLWAEPVLDLMAGVPSLADPDQIAARLADFDYEHDPEGDSAERLFFRKWQDGQCTHHLFVAATDSDYFERQLHIRNRLREDATTRTAFQRKKLELAGAHRDDRDAYLRALSELVTEMFDAAAVGGAAAARGARQTGERADSAALPGDPAVDTEPHRE